MFSEILIDEMSEEQLKELVREYIEEQEFPYQSSPVDELPF